MDTGTSFEILELAGLKRKIVLQGRALPYRPMTMKSSQRVELTWNPGITEATATVLGPKEEQTSCSGAWKDIHLGAAQYGERGSINSYGNAAIIVLNGRHITSVKNAVELFDSILFSGQELLVTWYIEKRKGFLKDFSKSWQNIHDCLWEMTFEWMSRGRPVAPPVIVNKSRIGSASTAMKRNLSDLLNLNLSQKLNPPIFQKIQTYITDLNKAVYDIDSAASQLAGGVNLPRNAANSIIGSCATLAETARTAVEFVGGLVVSDFTTSEMSGSDEVQTQVFRYEFTQICKELVRDALEQKDGFDAELTGELEGEYTARAGDDLRDVSTKFYKTPFEWRRIMQFNKLSTIELEAGQVVLVPRINPSSTLGGS